MQVVMVMVVTSDGVTSVATSAYILQTFETVIRHALTMQLEVQIISIWTSRNMLK
jgi:hypothetical protein